MSVVCGEEMLKMSRVQIGFQRDVGYLCTKVAAIKTCQVS